MLSRLLPHPGLEVSWKDARTPCDQAVKLLERKSTHPMAQLLARGYQALAHDRRQIAWQLSVRGLRQFCQQPGVEEFQLLLALYSEQDGLRQKACSEALAIRPQYAWARLIRGVSRLRQGRWKAAVTDHLATLKLTPRFRQALVLYWSGPAGRGQSTHTLTVLREAHRQAPPDDQPAILALINKIEK